VPADWQELIMHARLVSEDAVLMGGDAPPDRYSPTKGVCISIQVDEPAKAERIFNALSDGATVEMPIQETFWAVRFGMLTDRFGTPWMVNCEKAA
jgi:PhnB protein